MYFYMCFSQFQGLQLDPYVRTPQADASQNVSHLVALEDGTSLFSVFSSFITAASVLSVICWLLRDS